MENQNKMRCANCDVCCRFLDKETPLVPVGLTLKPYRDRFVCRNFDPRTNKCRDYENRPLDCRLYPFVVMWDEEYRNVVLGLDHKCPRVAEFQAPVLKDIDPKYTIRFQDDVEILRKLDAEPEPGLNKLLIGDKVLFEKYAAGGPRPLSSYSFIANYVWTDLLDYSWMVSDGNLCLFCKTGNTIFMPVPPFGKQISRVAVKRCFELMDRINKNKNCSRIEDICEKDAAFYEGLGYRIRHKGQEFIYERADLAKLAGDRYKDKRALCNYFMKNYRYEYREFKPSDKDECLLLYRQWAKERTKKGTVPNGDCPQDMGYYQALLEDSYMAHKKAMERFPDLGLVGRVVIKKGPQLVAYTLGYPLDGKTFVILFEVADLNIKGLPQFIFRRFCEELNTHKYINAMDDSGLENLKRVKMSYHPVKIEKTYCAYA